MTEQETHLPAFPMYSVGPDDLTEYDWHDIQGPYLWFVYWYKQGSYDGEGIAVALRKDGKMDIGDLGHCSCYGPTANWPYATQEIAFVLYDLEHDPDRPGGGKRMPEDFDYEQWQAVGIKVRELLATTEKDDAAT